MRLGRKFRLELHKLEKPFEMKLRSDLIFLEHANLSKWRSRCSWRQIRETRRMHHLRKAHLHGYCRLVLTKTNYASEIRSTKSEPIIIRWRLIWNMNFLLDGKNSRVFIIEAIGI